MDFIGIGHLLPFLLKHLFEIERLLFSLVPFGALGFQIVAVELASDGLSDMRRLESYSILLIEIEAKLIKVATSGLGTSRKLAMPSVEQSNLDNDFIPLPFIGPIEFASIPAFNREASEVI